MSERDRLVHRVRRCADETHGFRDGGSQIVGVEDPGRVGQSDDDLVVARAHGYGGEVSGELFGEKPRDLDVDLGGYEVDEREIVLLGDETSDVVCGHGPTSDENLAEPLAARDPLLCECCVDRFLREDPVPDEERAERGPRPGEPQRGRDWSRVGRRLRRGRGGRTVAYEERRGVARTERAELPRALEGIVDRGVDSRGRCDRKSKRNSERAVELVRVHGERRIRDRDEEGAIGEDADRKRVQLAGESLRK